MAVVGTKVARCALLAAALRHGRKMQADRPRQRPNRLPWSRWRHALGTLGRHQGTLLREVALPRAPVILRIREHPRHVVLLVMGTPSEQGPCTADALAAMRERPVFNAKRPAPSERPARPGSVS